MIIPFPSAFKVQSSLSQIPIRFDVNRFWMHRSWYELTFITFETELAIITIAEYQFISWQMFLTHFAF